MLLLPVAFSYGCSDAPTSPTARAGVTPHALLAPVVTVTNTDDAGPGSLRQAIIDAAAGASIQFDASIAGQTIVLSTGQLTVGKALTIEGPATTGMTISGGLNSRVFYVNAIGDLLVRNLSIVNGRTSDGGSGLFIEGKATIDHSLVANNEADGSSGGGIRLIDSSAELVLVNSTVSGNFASIVGGGIEAASTVSIRNSTIANNTAGEGGGIYVFDGFYSVRNSIIANNNGSDGPFDSNCSMGSGAVLQFSGPNLSNDGSCGFPPNVPNMLIADPKLGPLANNGGPTKTHALAESSPAIDAGTVCTEATDQRYVARNQGSSCDIGAFEFNDFGTYTLVIGPNVAVNAKTGTVTLTGTITCSKPGSVGFDVAMSQTQKTTGRFTTIVQAAAFIPFGACGTSPSSWSVALTPPTGKFEPGSATGTATTSVHPANFLSVTVTSPLKVFQVR